MPSEPDKLSKFWMELKRRKVTRVITVYAAAAFVILELVSIIADPLNLPEWTLTLVIVLVCIGFVIAVILAWIYDVGPEGIERTKPVQKPEKEDRTEVSGGWRVASYISFVVIAGLILLHLIPGKDRSQEILILDKSIAVLPFINDSQDNENAYIINGCMEAILDHLCKIEDLRVISRTSVEQYRNQPKSIPRIAEEMNVSYILEGSGQKYGNQLRLTLQLIDARNDRHLWSSPFQREIKSEDIFALQSEVAQLVAKEIKAIITPEEKERIEKIPTTSQTAYDLFLKGLEELRKYSIDNKEAAERAEDLFQYALDYDSTFAAAYAALAEAYWRKNQSQALLSEDLLDKVLVLTDIALSYDDQLAYVYVIRAEYYMFLNQFEQAITEIDQAIEYNPNLWNAYFKKGWYHRFEDPVKSLENLHKAESLVSAPENLSTIYAMLTDIYQYAGFTGKSRYYIEQSIQLDGDSSWYYRSLAWIEHDQGKFDKALYFAKEAYKTDTTNYSMLGLAGYALLVLGQEEEALDHFNQLIKRLENTGEEAWRSYFAMGYTYLLSGYQEEAEHYFSRSGFYYNKQDELGRLGNGSLDPYMDQASLFLVRGEKEKAYEIFRSINQFKIIPLFYLNFLKTSPFFNSIRDEAEFQQIVRDAEAKYRAEHERVRQWLEENDSS
jgi:TolB-like protein/Flp pilus assembly protein TadD